MEELVNNFISLAVTLTLWSTLIMGLTVAKLSINNQYTTHYGCGTPLTFFLGTLSITLSAVELILLNATFVYRNDTLGYSTNILILVMHIMIYFFLPKTFLIFKQLMQPLETRLIALDQSSIRKVIIDRLAVLDNKLSNLFSKKSP